MKDISVNYTIGNEIKQLTISSTSQGTGQIMLDKFYHGQVVFSQNKWNVYLNDKSELKTQRILRPYARFLMSE